MTICEWFLLCEYVATKKGKCGRQWVPICDRCLETVRLPKDKVRDI